MTKYDIYVYMYIESTDNPNIDSITGFNIDMINWFVPEINSSIFLIKLNRPTESSQWLYLNNLFYFSLQTIHTFALLNFNLKLWRHSMTG